jgi:hypothetical protein
VISSLFIPPIFGDFPLLLLQRKQMSLLPRVIHMSVKHLKNSQQINYATGHDNSYASIERETLQVFSKERPREELPWFATRKRPYHCYCDSGRPCYAVTRVG